MGLAQIIDLPILEFLDFPIIPVLDRPVIPGDTAVDLRLLSTVRAGILLPCQIPVFPADAVGGRQGKIGQLVVVGDFPYKPGGRLPIRQLFA